MHRPGPCRGEGGGNALGLGLGRDLGLSLGLNLGPCTKELNVVSHLVPCKSENLKRKEYTCNE